MGNVVQSSASVFSRLAVSDTGGLSGVGVCMLLWWTAQLLEHCQMPVCAFVTVDTACSV